MDLQHANHEEEETSHPHEKSHVMEQTRKNSIEKFFDAFRNAVAGVFYVMNKETTSKKVVAANSSSPIFSILLVATGYGQRLSFPLKQIIWEGNGGPLHELGKAFSIFSLSSELRKIPTGNLSLSVIAFFFAVLWCTMVFSVTIYVGLSFVRKRFTVLWPVRLLRITALITTSALLIPILNSLLVVFSCDEDNFWAETSMSCWGAGHSTLVALAIILIIFLAAFALLVASVFFPRHPHAANIDIRAHGRAAVITVATSIALSLVFGGIMPQDESMTISRNNLWFLRIFMLVLFTFVTFTDIYFCSYSKIRMMKAHFTVNFFITWAAFGALLAPVLGEPEAQTIIFLGIPPILILMPQIVETRIEYIRRASADTLNSPWLIEVKARLLHQELFEKWYAMIRQENDAIYNTNNGSALTRRGKSSATVFPSSAIYSHNGAFGFQDGNDVQDRCFNEVEDLYRRISLLHPGNAAVHMLHAAYLGSHGGSTQRQTLHLTAAERKDPALDVWLLVFQWKRALEDDDSSGLPTETHGGMETDSIIRGSGQMSVLHRVAFEKYFGDGLREARKARSQLLQFFSLLSNPMPDLDRLYEVGDSLTEAIAKAETAFSMALNLNRRDVDLLRKYAAFLNDVASNELRSLELLEEADDLEEGAQKAGRNKPVSLNLLAAPVTGKLDTTSGSVILVPLQIADDSQLPNIASESTAMQKFLGINGVDLTGEMLPSLMARPCNIFLASMINAWVRGESVQPFNAPALTLLHHKNGNSIASFFVLQRVRDGVLAIFQEASISSDEGTMLFIVTAQSTSDAEEKPRKHRKSIVQRRSNVHRKSAVSIRTPDGSNASDVQEPQAIINGTKASNWEGEDLHDDDDVLACLLGSENEGGTDELGNVDAVPSAGTRSFRGDLEELQNAQSRPRMPYVDSVHEPNKVHLACLLTAADNNSCKMLNTSLASVTRSASFSLDGLRPRKSNLNTTVQVVRGMAGTLSEDDYADQFARKEPSESIDLSDHFLDDTLPAAALGLAMDVMNYNKLKNEAASNPLRSTLRFPGNAAGISANSASGSWGSIYTSPDTFLVQGKHDRFTCKLQMLQSTLLPVRSTSGLSSVQAVLSPHQLRMATSPIRSNRSNKSSSHLGGTQVAPIDELFSNPSDGPAVVSDLVDDYEEEIKIREALEMITSPSTFFSLHWKRNSNRSINAASGQLIRAQQERTKIAVSSSSSSNPASHEGNPQQPFVPDSSSSSPNTKRITNATASRLLNPHLTPKPSFNMQLLSQNQTYPLSVVPNTSELQPSVTTRATVDLVYPIQHANDAAPPLSVTSQMTPGFDDMEGDDQDRTGRQDGREASQFFPDDPRSTLSIRVPNDTVLRAYSSVEDRGHLHSTAYNHQMPPTHPGTYDRNNTSWALGPATEVGINRGHDPGPVISDAQSGAIGNTNEPSVPEARRMKSALVARSIRRLSNFIGMRSLSNSKQFLDDAFSVSSTESRNSTVNGKQLFNAFRHAIGADTNDGSISATTTTSSTRSLRSLKRSFFFVFVVTMIAVVVDIQLHDKSRHRIRDLLHLQSSSHRVSTSMQDLHLQMQALAFIDGGLLSEAPIKNFNVTTIPDGNSTEPLYLMDWISQDHVQNYYSLSYPQLHDYEYPSVAYSSASFSVSSVAGADLIIGYAESLIRNLESLTRDVYGLSQSVLSGAKHSALFHDQGAIILTRVQTSSNDESSTTLVRHNSDLFSATTLYLSTLRTALSRARRIYNASIDGEDLTEPFMSNSAIWAILNHDAISQGYLDVHDLSQQEGEEELEFMSAVASCVAIALALFLDVVLIAYTGPLLNQIENARDQVLRAFMYIPLASVQALQTAMESKLINDTSDSMDETGYDIFATVETPDGTPYHTKITEGLNVETEKQPPLIVTTSSAPQSSSTLLGHTPGTMSRAGTPKGKQRRTIASTARPQSLASEGLTHQPLAHSSSNETANTHSQVQSHTIFDSQASRGPTRSYASGYSSPATASPRVQRHQSMHQNLTRINSSSSNTSSKMLGPAGANGYASTRSMVACPLVEYDYHYDSNQSGAAPGPIRIAEISESQVSHSGAVDDPYRQSQGQSRQLETTTNFFSQSEAEKLDTAKKAAHAQTRSNNLFDSRMESGSFRSESGSQDDDISQDMIEEKPKESNNASNNALSRPRERRFTKSSKLFFFLLLRFAGPRLLILLFVAALFAVDTLNTDMWKWPIHYHASVGRRELLVLRALTNQRYSAVSGSAYHLAVDLLLNKGSVDVSPRDSGFIPSGRDDIVSWLLPDSNRDLLSSDTANWFLQSEHHSVPLFGTKATKNDARMLVAYQQGGLFGMPAAVAPLKAISEVSNSPQHTWVGAVLGDTTAEVVELVSNNTILIKGLFDAYTIALSPKPLFELVSQGGTGSDGVPGELMQPPLQGVVTVTGDYALSSGFSHIAMGRLQEFLDPNTNPIPAGDFKDVYPRLTATDSARLLTNLNVISGRGDLRKGKRAPLQLITEANRIRQLSSLYVSNGCARSGGKNGLIADVVSPRTTLVQQRECFEFEDGLLTNGLHAALLHYASFVADSAMLFETKGPIEMAPPSGFTTRSYICGNLSPTVYGNITKTVCDALTSPASTSFETLGRVHLMNGMRVAGGVHKHFWTESNDRYVTAHLIILLTIIFFFLLIYGLTYAPAINAVEASLSRTVRLLLLLPPQVAVSVPPIFMLMTNIIRGAQLKVQLGLVEKDNESRSNASNRLQTLESNGGKKKAPTIRFA